MIHDHPSSRRNLGDLRDVFCHMSKGGQKVRLTIDLMDLDL